MTIAQSATYAEQKSRIRISNTLVYSLFKQLKPLEDEPMATAEELIGFLTNSRHMTAIEGKRVSNPIYRALSEGADEGILDDDQTVINVDTGMLNTLYKLLKVRRKGRTKADTWKRRAVKAEETLKELQIKYEIACKSIDRLTEKLNGISQNS